MQRRTLHDIHPRPVVPLHVEIAADEAIRLSVAGDHIEIVSRPSHGITLHDMVEAMRDDAKAALIRGLPKLPSFWRKVANRV